MDFRLWPFLTRCGGLLLLLAAAMIGLHLYELDQERQLWGHWPLWLYLTAYGGLVTCFYPFKFPQPPPPEVKNARPEALLHVGPGRALLWSSATGILLGLGYPGYGPWPFLLLFAFVPLLLLQRELRLSGSGSRRVFFHGFNAFFLFNALATFWVANTAFAPGIFAVVANSLLMCIPWMLFHFTSHHLPRVAYFALPHYWVAFEWGHHNWELAWPWLTLGNGLAQFPQFAQWYAYTGAMGGSLWIWFVNVILFGLAGSRFVDGLWASPAGSPYQPTAEPGYPWRWWKIIVIFLPPLLSLSIFYGWTNEVAMPEKSGRAPLRIAAIQPNFEPHYEKFTVSPRARLDSFLRLSRAALAQHPELDYLIFPETSFDRIDEDSPLADRDLRRLRDALAESELRYLVTGFDGYHVFGPNEPRTPAVRETTDRNGRPLAFEALNAALQLGMRDGEVQTYRKGVFVPGAESFPFRDYLPFAKPLVDALGGSVAGRGTQAERSVFRGAAAVAPVICYESVFGAYFTEYVQAGAEIAFVMTNDGWWGNTAGHRQHLYLSSLRAIETDRPVVRSANVGACAFIDRQGRILSRTEYDKEGFLYGELRPRNGQTFYVRYGDWMPLILSIGSIFFLVAALVLWWRSRRS